MKTGDRLTARVLLIGWEAAEWNIIAPLVEAGELRNLNRLIDQGVIGRLAAFDPPLPPVAWTSVITGKHPQDHGILGFEEPAENGIDVRPFSPASRRCKAVWNILSDAGLTCHAIGWPATWPAEKLNGVALGSTWDETDTRPQFDSGAVWPSEFAETATELRMNITELNINDLRPFIPAIGADDLTDPAILTLGRAVASAASRQAAATYLMENKPWDFLAVYFPSLDQIIRSFIEFHPPRLPHLNDAGFEKFRGVVTEAYRFHDQMLGRLVDLAGPETTVFVCSTRGVQTGGARATRVGLTPISMNRDCTMLPPAVHQKGMLL